LAGDHPSDVLAFYLRELRQRRPLSADGGTRSVAEDEGATRQLIHDHLRLVVKIAKRHQGRGLSLADLIQEGNLGLIEAARTYRGDPTIPFARFAAARIQWAIRNAIRSTGEAVRIPRVSFTRVREQLARQLGRAPTEAEVDPEVARRRAARRIPPLRLDELCGEGEDDRSQGEKLGDSQAALPLTTCLRLQALTHVRSALASLPAREAAVIRLRFGFDDQGECSLAETGTILGMPEPAVRRLQARGLRKLLTPA